MDRSNRYIGHQENSGESQLVQRYQERLGAIAEVLEVQKTSRKVLFRLNTSQANIPKELWGVAHSLSGDLSIADDGQVWVVCDRPRTIPLGLRGLLVLLFAAFLVWSLHRIRVYVEPFLDFLFS